MWYQGKLDVQPGTGRLIELPVFGPLYDGIQQQGGNTAERLVKAFAAVHGNTPVERPAPATAAAALPGSTAKEEL